MKKLTWILLLFPFLTACEGRQDSAKEKEKLKNIISAYYEAMANKDFQKVSSMTTGNFIMFENGKVYNNRQVADDVNSLPPFKASFTFDSLNVYIGKTNASAYYYRAASFTVNDSVYAPVSFLESATFDRVGGEWKIRFLHSSIRR